MKLSFTGKIRMIILIMMIITVLQGIILLQMIPQNAANKIDIQNTIYIISFVQIIFAIIIISYIPTFLQRAFNEIHRVMKDLTQGIYHIDIDLDDYEKRADKEFLAIFSSIVEMVKSVAKFDALKKDKIVEHHNRIQAILNLSEAGFMVIDNKGQIVYTNDKVLATFPSMNEKNSIIDSNFAPEIENNLKKYALQVIKSGSKQPNQNSFFPSLKKHITLSSAMVRNSSGSICGAVIALTNLPKKEEKKLEQEK